MKIVFITPAANIRRTTIYRLAMRLYGSPSPITGPLILGSILKAAGHEVEVYEELYQKIKLNKLLKADIIGISTMTSSAPRAYELAAYFKKHNKKVIIGGMHASVRPEEALQHCDQVIIGEAENTILDVVNGKINNKIIKSRPVKNLDNLPRPDYNLLKTPYKTANLLSTRGCPYKCSFCTTTRMFHPYRERSINSIIAELKLYKKMGFKHVNFQDDNFTANKKRTKKLLRAIIKNNLLFKDNFFFGRTDMAQDKEMLELLSTAHFRTVLIGIESINQKSLDLIDKQQKVANIKQCGTELIKYKIKIIASIVLGLDFDNKNDLHKTVQFCRKINAYRLQPPPLTPYPGTPLYNQFVREKRLLIKDWQYYDMMHVTYIPRKLSALGLQREFIKAIYKFYSLGSSLKLLFIFGPQAALNRLFLSVILFWGSIFSKIKENKYYRLLKINAKQEKLLTRFTVSPSRSQKKNYKSLHKLKKIFQSINQYNQQYSENNRSVVQHKIWEIEKLLVHK
ncbi:MAG TPA: radical SAM protein [Spirochaetota bacterium]|nr:radical SAM protein [Spirochaetota bacterium]